LRQEQPEFPPALQTRLEDLGLAFLGDFLEQVTQRQPANVEALAELGHVYTRQGRIEEGLNVDRKLVRLVPDNPTVHYNLACSLAILERRDDALDALEQAIELGYADADFMGEDPDLSNLRDETRFSELIRRLLAASS
jgi:Flp pilus assembly protein TadD